MFFILFFQQRVQLTKEQNDKRDAMNGLLPSASPPKAVDDLSQQIIDLELSSKRLSETSKKLDREFDELMKGDI